MDHVSKRTGKDNPSAGRQLNAGVICGQPWLSDCAPAPSMTGVGEYEFDERVSIALPLTGQHSMPSKIGPDAAR